MTYIFDNSQPIYLQLIEIFKTYIANETWLPGQKIDSVRILALEFGVNPNTVQRSLTELESAGLAYSLRTSGRFITEDQAKIEKLKQDLANSLTEKYISQIRTLKLPDIEIKKLLDHGLTKGF